MRAFRLLLVSFAALFLALLTACGGSSSTPAPVVVIPPPVITSFSADKPMITVGQSAMLTAVFSAGTGAVNNGVGVVQNSSPVAVTPAATTTYTLTVTNSANVSDTRTAIVQVVAAPTIASFVANPTSVTLGQSSLLTPTYANGTGSINQGVGPVSSGTAVIVTPIGTTSYILTVINATGSTATLGAVVTVVGAPVITSFTAVPTTITVGGSSVLTPVFSGGNGVISPTVGAVSSGNEQSVSPAVTTTYTLTVTNGVGAATTATRIINVVSGPFNISLTANPTLLTEGSATTLTPTFSGGTGTIDHGVGHVLNGVAIAVTPVLGTTTYTLIVDNGVGATDSASVTVQVIAKPSIISFTGAPASITFGQSAQLNPTFSNGTGAINQGVGAVVNAVPVVVTPPSSTTYILTVTNAAGSTTTAGTVILVVAAPVITSFTATPSSITAGQTSNLLAVFTGGGGVVTPTVGVVGSGSNVAVNPTVTTTYLLTVTNSNGVTDTRSTAVTVISNPFNISLSANPTLITVGDVSTLMPTFGGGTGVIDFGVGPVVSGVPVPVTPALTTIYTLTVTNSLGAFDQRGVTVTVVPKPVIISFGNSPSTITAGASTTLTAVFTGGVGVVTPGVGVIASTFPLSVNPPSTTTYTLTVTNAAGYSVFQTLTVLVNPAPGAASFTANPPFITLGGCSALIASFQGGSGDVSPGIGSVTSGVPSTVCPIVTTLYTLTINNGAGGVTTLSTTVTVVVAPICSLAFNANAPGAGLNIPEGGSGNLVATFPTGVGIINGVGNVLTGVPYPVNPVVNTTYILTVTNPAGATCTSSLTVTIIPNPHITSFVAVPPIVTAGTSTNLIGTFNGQGGAPGDAIIRDQVPTTLFSSVQSGTANAVTPPITTTYTLEVRNLLGVAAFASITATVIPAPVITVFEQCTLAGAPAVGAFITAGDTAYLHGTFINGTGQVDHGIGNFLSGLLGPTAVSPNVSTTYTLTVTNSAGSTALANATILVLSGPNASAIVANPIYVTNLGVGSSETAFITPYFTVGTFGTAVVTAAEAISLAPVAIPPSLTTPLTGVPVGVNTLNVDTVFTLTVSNGAVPTPVTTTQGVVVHVLPLPTAVLTTNGTPAGNPIITKGQSVGLMPTITPAIGVTAVITPGVGPVTTGGTYSVSPSVTTTYTLTVTNAAGYSVTASVTVVVVDGPFAAAFYASPSTIRVGDFTTFFAIFNPLPVLGTATVTDLTSGTFLPYTPTSGLGVVQGPFATAGFFQFQLNLDNGAGGIQDVFTTLTVAPALTAIALDTNVIAPPADTITKGQTINLLPTWAPVGLGNGTVDNGVGSVINGGTYTVAPQITTTYTLTVADSAGVAGTVQKTVVVLDGPFASAVYADRSKITNGDIVHITSVFNNPGPLGSASLANDAAPATVPASPQIPVSGVATPYTINLGALATPAKVVFDLDITNGVVPAVNSHQSAIVTVYEAPVITSFTASASPIGLGASSDLLPIFTGGAADIIAGGEVFSIGGVHSGGAYTVSPAYSTTYTLVVTNPAGRQVIATVTVGVVQPPVIDSFTATPPIITAGDSTTLYPIFHNAVAADASITPGFPAPNTSGVGILDSPIATTTYTLLVTNANGSASANTTVTVVAPPQAVINGPSNAFITQPNLTYTVAPQAPGTTYNWSVDNGGVITGGFGTNQITVTAGNLFGPWVAATSGMRVSITVTNAANSSVSGTLDVTLANVVAPTAGLLVQPGLLVTGAVEPGNSVTLQASWGGSVITGVINPGNVPVNIGAGSPVDVILSPITQTTVYTFTATGPTGLFATAQATVSLVPPPTITSFTASPVIITVGKFAVLTGIFTRDFAAGASAVVTRVVGPPPPFAPTPATSGVGIPFLGAAVGTNVFSLTVTNSAGTSIVRQATVTVVAAPAAVALGANGGIVDVLIQAGETATLQPTWTAGPGLSGAINQGLGFVLSGSNYAVTPLASTTYTLTVTNTAGDTGSAVRTVYVLSGQFGVSFTANPMTTTEGGSTDLTAIFKNCTASVSGVGPALWTYGPTPYTTGVPQTVLLNSGTPGNYTFTLTLTGTGAFTGLTDTRTLTVSTLAAPTGTFTINGVAGPVTITQGQTVSLLPTFGGGTGSINQGIGNVTSLQTYTATPPATTSYVLTVTNAAGDSVGYTVTAIVVQGPFGLALTAFPSNMLTDGDPVWITPIFTVPNGPALSADITFYGIAPFGPIPVVSGGTLGPLPIVNFTGIPENWTAILTVVDAGGVSQTYTLTGIAYPLPSGFISVATNPINAGDTTVLNVGVFGGTGYVPGIGSVPAGTHAYSVNPTATTTYTLTVTNPVGYTSTTSTTLVVNPLAGQASLVASDSLVTVGEFVTLTSTWNPNAGTGGVAPAIGPVTNGQSVLVAPALGTTIWTLTVTNGVNVSTSSASVTAVAAPSGSLAALPLAINPGSTSTLTVTLAAGNTGVLQGFGTVVNAQAIVVAPTSTTTYYLVVTNAAGTSITAFATVTVNPVPGSPSLTASDNLITVGDSITLLPSWAPNTGTGVISPGAIAATNGVPTALITPALGTTVYTLTVTQGTLTTTAGTAVTAVAVPIAGLAASLTTINAGSSTVLTSTVGNGTAVLSGFGSVVHLQAVTVSPISTTTYSLTVTNAAGAIATASVQVTVLQTPLAISLSATPAFVTLGDAVTLTPVFLSATSGTITNPSGGGTLVSTVGTSGVPFSDITTALGLVTYQLDAVNGTQTATTGASVNVIALPVITGFSAVASGNPGFFDSGDNLVWTITYTDGGTNTNGVFSDVIQGTSTAVNSTQTVITNIPFVGAGIPLTFTLKVTNAAGTSVVATVTYVTTF